ncbi:hypothetical protein RQP46_006990 [Phenoliferia psychrophenolica]
MHLTLPVLVTSLSLLAAAHRPVVPIEERSTSSAAHSFPEKHDSLVTSQGLNTPEAIAAAILANRPGLKAALAAGKALPRVRNPKAEAVAKRATGARWDFVNQKIRGVNLGGFLVLEPWITPSLFNAVNNNAAVDEWTYTQILGRREATSRLKQHWNTWITQSDINAIAAAGLNHVRIPIGYWAFDISAGEPYVQGQYPYLLQTIQWCKAAGIRVIVDIHGGPGSQNGFDNSGRRGNIGWHTQQSNVQRTKAVLQTLSAEFEKATYNGVVTALQYLNEPAGFYSPDVVKVYKNALYDAYGVVHYPTSSTPSQMALSIHDAFQPLSSWQGYMPPPNFQSVSLDTHIYTVFTTDSIALDPAQRIQAICNMRSSLATSQKNLYTIVGEWSTAPNDCATSLNGRGIGSRYDGSFPGSTRQGSCTGHTGPTRGLYSSYKTYLRKYWEAQVTVYEQSTSGYVMWAWKTESADDWSWQAGLAGGWIPRDPTQRMYANPCS